MTRVNKTAFLLVYINTVCALSTVNAVLTNSLRLVDWLIVVVLYFLGACIGGTMTYHRLLSHRSWKAPQWFVILGSLCGAYFPIGSPLAWANNHRAHHRFSDRPGDPHNPRAYGVFLTQLASPLCAVKSLSYAKNIATPFQIRLHKAYFWWHLLFPLSLWLTFGTHTVLVWYVVPSFFVWQLPALITTLNHLKGYRNFDTPDKSTNNPITGYLVFGEGWHNNHHANSRSPLFGVRPWELDIGGFLVKVLDKNVR